jgi:transcriptional regulator with XRE-family HTH domain
VPSTPHPLLKAIGAKLRSRRLALKWSEERLAAEADISTPYVSEVELGKRNLSLRVFLRIVRALGAKAGDILD